MRNNLGSFLNTFVPSRQFHGWRVSPKMKLFNGVIRILIAFFLNLNKRITYTKNLMLYELHI